MALNDTQGGATSAARAEPRRFSLSAIKPSSRYYWIRVLLENPTALISLGILLVIMLLAAAAPVIAPQDPDFLDPAVRLQGPSSDHWFGTDVVGRDVYSRVLYGGRISILVGICVMFGAAIIGSLIGLIAGYYQRIDTPLMRVMDGLEAFPGILLAIAIMATLGASTRNVIIALIVIYTSNVARLVRSTTLVNKNQMYVEAARAIGMRDFQILGRYVYLNSLSPLIVQCTFIVAFAILAEAALSFLGAGVPPGVATWGNMVGRGQDYLETSWWQAVFPGTALFLTVLAINLIGDGLRDALDPRSRDR